jgi:pimeloyl-ACP methyl ester carboxylesterase
MIAILPFSGFTEKRKNARGIEDIWAKVLLPLATRQVVIYSPEVWSQNPKVLLSEMRRVGIRRVMLIGYSWGAGYGCINFARHARNFGVEIPHACFCDPVYRSRLLPHWLPLNPLSLLRGQRILVPPAIQQVRWVKQETDIPGGNTLIPEDPFHTLIHNPIVLNTTHARIDEHYHWVDLVKKTVQDFIHTQQ